MENIAEVMNEFEDWEVIRSNSDTDSANTFDEIDSEGSIKANYFLIDSQNRSYLDDNQTSESDHPSWIDPESDENPIRYPNKEHAEFGSDFSSGRSDDQKFSHLEIMGQMGFSANEKNQVGFKGNGEVVDIKGENTEDSAKFCPNLGETEDLCVESNTSLRDELDVSGEENLKIDVTGDVCDVMNGNGKNKHGEIEKSRVVWWKMPMDFLKFCVLRMSPVWTVSAAVGFAVLGLRLYKMKNKKEKGLKIRVTLDDKTSSHVLSRAARLNEAFSVVKRVTVIRPPMPADGVTTWPAMSLR